MSGMSPEKQQELADRILERAELAQMARKLKLGLGKVASPKKSNSNASFAVRSRKGSISGTDATSEVPAVKSAGRARVQSVSKPGHLASESPTRRSVMKPPAARRDSLSSTSAGTSATSANESNGIPPVPSTPKSKSSENSAPVEPGSKNGTQGHDEGTDLLMYLATSPYVSNSNNTASRRPSISNNFGHQHTQGVGMPSTPSSHAYVNQTTVDSESQLHDIVRLSHMKERASTNSPQSTFKQPVMIPSNNNALHDLMQSPSASMFTSPRRRLATDDQQLLAPGTPSRIGLSASAIHPEQMSDSQSRIGSLLKTPNFNMGDYVHTLFSPSPRIDTAPHSKE